MSTQYDMYTYLQHNTMYTLAHRMPYFSVLGILKYGIGWRPQIAPFENCSIWELLHLRIAPFENRSIWELLHLRNAPFEKCSIWEMLHLRNMRMKTIHTFWEGCNFNQDGLFNLIKTVTCTKKSNVPGNTQRVNDRKGPPWKLESWEWSFEILKEVFLPSLIIYT